MYIIAAEGFQGMTNASPQAFAKISWSTTRDWGPSATMLAVGHSALTTGDGAAVDSVCLLWHKFGA